MRGYDVIVLGLGGMGSAAAAHLAKRGKRVLGLDQFALGHALGASAGRSRIIRKAYFEGPGYIPLLLRAYELWYELERDTGARVLDLVGLLMAGAADGPMLRGIQSVTAAFGLQVETLGSAETAKRFPQVRPLAGEIVLYEAQAGAIFPEAAIAAHQQTAHAHGADLRGDTKVLTWRRSATGTIRAETGDKAFEADALVVTAGPWLSQIARQLKLPISVQRNVQIWFEPQTPAFGRDRFPAYFLERASLPRPLYGFPDFGAGIKAALHTYGALTTPDSLDREIHKDDIDVVRAALDEWIPGAAGAFRCGKACMYALTPDEHFIIDRHPHDAGIVIAGGFSGHGYKFCSVVGEIVADLVDGTTRHDIDFLSLNRFALA